jgi:hypothetical protein
VHKFRVSGFLTLSKGAALDSMGSTGRVSSLNALFQM